MHTFSLDALLPDQYRIDKPFQRLTQFQRHPSRSQSEEWLQKEGRGGLHTHGAMSHMVAPE